MPPPAAMPLPRTKVLKSIGMARRRERRRGSQDARGFQCLAGKRSSARIRCGPPLCVHPVGDHWAPKRGFRLSRPVFSKVELMVFTMMSGCPPGMYCTRHSTELPLPLGLTSSMPV